MQEIKKISNVLELKIKDSDEVLKVDFTDKRLINKLLKLLRKYQHIEDYVSEKMQKLTDITDTLVAYIKSEGIDIESADELSDENIEEFLQNKVPENKKEIIKQEIEGTNIELMIAASDLEIDILQDFKNEVDDAFNAPITNAIFGNTLPPLEYYVELFDMVTPYIQQAKLQESKTIESINKKYNLDNVVNIKSRKNM